MLMSVNTCILVHVCWCIHISMYMHVGMYVCFVSVLMYVVDCMLGYVLVNSCFDRLLMLT